MVMVTVDQHYPLNDGAETINEIGSSIRRVMGGTRADVFEGAISAVMLYGGAAACYRTMLDALIPASALLTERLSGGDDPLDAFVKSSDAAVTGAESTKQMEAQAGRSTYVSAEALSSVPDPGAMAAAAWYRAAALALKHKFKPSPSGGGG
ncbi:hypothetical protein LXL04_034278 [Taraxacum kok-saghyz]